MLHLSPFTSLLLQIARGKGPSDHHSCLCLGLVRDWLGSHFHKMGSTDQDRRLQRTGRRRPVLDTGKPTKLQDTEAQISSCHHC